MTQLSALLRAHYAMAADEWREGQSDVAVRRRYDAAIEAENVFTKSLKDLAAQNAELRRALEELLGAKGVSTVSYLYDELKDMQSADAHDMAFVVAVERARAQLAKGGAA